MSPNGPTMRPPRVVLRNPMQHPARIGVLLGAVVTIVLLVLNPGRVAVVLTVQAIFALAVMAVLLAAVTAGIAAIGGEFGGSTRRRPIRGLAIRLLAGALTLLMTAAIPAIVWRIIALVSDIRTG